MTDVLTLRDLRRVASGHAYVLSRSASPSVSCAPALRGPTKNKNAAINPANARQAKITATLLASSPANPAPASAVKIAANTAALLADAFRSC